MIEGLKCEICKAPEVLESTRPFCTKCCHVARALTRSRGARYFKEDIDCPPSVEMDFAFRFGNPNDWDGFPCMRCRDKPTCEFWAKTVQEVKKFRKGVPTKEHLKGVKDGLTNKEIADHLGISKRKVAKMRAAGELDIEKIREEMNQ